MSSRLLTGLFLIICIIQLYIPFSMIRNQNKILQHGTSYKFRTAPIDPNDPFLGKYVRLHFTASEAIVDNNEEWGYDDEVFVTLDTDETGFAKIKEVTRKTPGSSDDFVRARIRYIERDSVCKLFLDYAFDKFYMEEFKAPEAEKVYMESRVDSTQIAYALIKVKNGKSAIENVYINDIPIKTVVEQRIAVKE
jgi:uncharacterized membrane-anchored protein